VLFLVHSMKPEVLVLGLDERGVLRNAKRHNLNKMNPKVTAIRFDGELYFANVSYFEQSILYLIGRDPDIKFILVVGNGITSIDASGVEMLKNLLERLEKSGITLVFSSMTSSVRDVLIKAGVCHRVGSQNVYVTQRDAVEGLTRRLAEMKDKAKVSEASG